MNVLYTLAATVLLIAIALSGWPVTNLVLTLSSRTRATGINRGQDSPRRNSTTNPPKKKVPTSDGGLRGGLWIGIIERFATAAAILLGQPTLIAVIVAVKGLGRFKELSTPEASERFVLGTLTSLTWAALTATLGMEVLTTWLI